MESKEHHITHKEQHELNEQQLGSVKGGGLKRAKATWDLTELGKSLSDIENSSKVKNPLIENRRGGWTARLSRTRIQTSQDASRLVECEPRADLTDDLSRCAARELQETRQERGSHSSALS